MNPRATPLAWFCVGCVATDQVDTDPGLDTDGPVSFFFEMSGTFDGTAFETSSAADELEGRSIPNQGLRTVTLECEDADGTHDGTVLVIGDEGGSWTMCDLDHSVQVTDRASRSFVSCGVAGATAFMLDVHTWEQEEDGTVTWGGDFSMTAHDPDASADVTGSFYGVSPALEL